MNLCTLKNNNSESNFINVYNWSNFIIRYTGVYFVGGFGSRFCTEPIFPLDNKMVTFPNDATKVECRVDRWLVDKGKWDDISLFSQRFPGGYCYRATGTEISPRFDKIECP